MTTYAPLGLRCCLTEQLELTLCKTRRDENGSTSPLGTTPASDTPPARLGPAASNAVHPKGDSGTSRSS